MNKLFPLLLITLTIFISSCSSDVPIPTPTVSGDYSGYYTLDPNDTVIVAENGFNFSFKNDGALEVSLGDNVATGTWTQSGKEVTGTYKFPTNTTTFSFRGDLTDNGNQKSIAGLWYMGTDASVDAEGYFKINSVN